MTSQDLSLQLGRIRASAGFLEGAVAAMKDAVRRDTDEGEDYFDETVIEQIKESFEELRAGVIAANEAVGDLRANED